MKPNNRISILIIICLSVLLSLNSYAVDFNLNISNEDSVKFKSTAKLEFVSGKTNYIIGGFSFDPENNKGIIDGKFQVDLRTIKTGIDLRDTHMRENHLDTEKYPYTFLKLSQVEGLPDKLMEDSVYKGIVYGEFYLHGIKKDISSDISVSVKTNTGNNIAIRVKANFTIRLEDFDIPHPKALFLKIAKEIAVEVSLIGYTEAEDSEFDLPDWGSKP
jgi:polyisoprenoid-binding protein YceI